MTENLEQYLVSEKAAADVAGHMRGVRAPRWDIEERGPWLWVTHADVPYAEDFSRIGVYFRLDGEDAATLQPRYVVTDLGEAVRALWLLSGSLCHPSQMLRVPWSIGDVLSVVHPFHFQWEGHAMTLRHVSIADLPRAICALMMAVHRVSRLDVPHAC